MVDDSFFMRKIIADLLTSDPVLEVVGTAPNGAVALKKIPLLNPDVVTLDVEMPVMDGMATLENIMKKRMLPVVMLSSSTQRGAEITIKALQNGAVDFVPKPSGTVSLDLNKVKDELIKKIKIAAMAKVRSSLIRESEVTEVGRNKKLISRMAPQTLVLIGASTGGPRALNEILPRIPGDVQAAFLVVQHMPRGFTRSLAVRLDQNSELRVKEAEDGERVVAGTVYLAPGGYHLQIHQCGKAGREIYLRLDTQAPVNGHRPSVDVMMHSAAELQGRRLVGVILTGMGHDGRSGTRMLKEKGAQIIAEDKTTAVVYGMPKAVVEANLSDCVAPLQLIAQKILGMLKAKE